MPTVSHPKNRPPKRNDAGAEEDGAPNEGARPPAAGGTGGASGDNPSPGGTWDPGKESVGTVGAESSARAGPAARSSAIGTKKV